jgi:hypothetical protein
MQKIQSRFAVLAVLAPLLAAAPAALAFETVDTLPWPSRGRFPAYVAEPLQPTDYWVEGGVMRDDNVLRRQSAREGDTIARVGAGMRYEQRIVGRQRLRFDGRVDGYGFQNFDTLNHVAYAVAGNWLWEVGNDLSGTVIAARERRLADLGERQEATLDLITLTRLAATGAYRLGPSTRVRAGIDYTRGERSLRPDVNLRGTSLVFGADYVTVFQNFFGMEYRTTQGDAPVPEAVAQLGTFVNNDFSEHELAFVSTYLTPDRRLRVDGRLGKTRRTYTQVPGRDFSGATYRAGAEWFMGVKTGLEFFVYKEPRSILDVAASHVVLNGIAMGPKWAYSQKLVFSLRWLHERRQFVGDPALASAAVPLRDELVNTVRFGIGWEPERHWQVGLGLDGGTRASNFFGRSYHYWAAMGNVAYRY